MAYQDIKRAKTAITLAPWASDRDKVNVILQEYQQLAQEVVKCHNRVVRFQQQITGVGITTGAVTIPFTMPSTLYNVSVAFGANAGNWWVNGRTTTGFTLNWATALTNPSVSFLIVD